MASARYHRLQREHGWPDRPVGTVSVDDAIDLERHHLVRVARHLSAPSAIASESRQTTESWRGGCPLPALRRRAWAESIASSGPRPNRTRFRSSIGERVLRSADTTQSGRVIADARLIHVPAALDDSGTEECTSLGHLSAAVQPGLAPLTGWVHQQPRLTADWVRGPRSASRLAQHVSLVLPAGSLLCVAWRSRCWCRSRASATRTGPGPPPRRARRSTIGVLNNQKANAGAAGTVVDELIRLGRPLRGGARGQGGAGRGAGRGHGPPPALRRGGAGHRRLRVVHVVVYPRRRHPRSAPACPPSVICSDEFGPLGRAEAEVLGFAGLPLIPLPHPLAGNHDDLVVAKARAVAAEVARRARPPTPPTWPTGTGPASSASPSAASTGGAVCTDEVCAVDLALARG